MRRATTPSESIRVVRHESVFRGSLLDVYVDQIETSHGESIMREVVAHPGAAAVVALPSSDELLLVRQYRHPVRSDLWEIPAGKVEPGEDALSCARRELLEETGYAADDWTQLCSLHMSPGFSDERITLFRATGLRQAGPPCAREIAERLVLRVNDAVRWVRSSAITDAKTILGILWLLRSADDSERR